MAIREPFPHPGGAEVILPIASYKFKQRSDRDIQSQTLTLTFNSMPLVLPSDGALVENYLYQTPTYFKGVDFMAVKKNVFGGEGQYLDHRFSGNSTKNSFPSQIKKDSKHT